MEIKNKEGRGSGGGGKELSRILSANLMKLLSGLN